MASGGVVTSSCRSLPTFPMLANGRLLVHSYAVRECRLHHRERPLGEADRHSAERGDGDCSEVNQSEEADKMTIEVQSEIQGPVSLSKCRSNRHMKAASATRMIGKVKNQCISTFATRTEQSRQAEYDRLTALPRSRCRTLRQCPVEQPYAVRALSQRESLIKLDARAAG
jgi:hypothetical protein